MGHRDVGGRALRRRARAGGASRRARRRQRVGRADAPDDLVRLAARCRRPRRAGQLHVDGDSGRGAGRARRSASGLGMTPRTFSRPRSRRLPRRGAAWWPTALPRSPPAASTCSGGRASTRGTAAEDARARCSRSVADNVEQLGLAAGAHRAGAPRRRRRGRAAPRNARPARARTSRRSTWPRPSRSCRWRGRFGGSSRPRVPWCGGQRAGRRGCVVGRSQRRSTTAARRPFRRSQGGRFESRRVKPRLRSRDSSRTLRHGVAAAHMHALWSSHLVPLGSCPRLLRSVPRSTAGAFASVSLVEAERRLRRRSRLPRRSTRS